jgi:hypothetical protein
MLATLSFPWATASDVIPALHSLSVFPIRYAPFGLCIVVRGRAELQEVP